MRLSSGYEERKARIEMLPLMDVMFLILVFFITSVFSMSIHRGLKVELPSAQGSPQKGELIMITLTADSQLYLNKKPMVLEELVSETVRLWQLRALPVVISADQAAPLGVGINLLGKLKRSGVERVAFQVSGANAAGREASAVPAHEATR